MKLHRLGENGLILKAESSAHSLDQVLFWKRQITALELEGVGALIPAYDNLTLHFDPLVIPYEVLVEIVLRACSADGNKEELITKAHKIPVCYDKGVAPDIVKVAEICGLQIDEVVDLHTSSEYRVAGIGFSPGFGFLEGLPKQLECARLDTPRSNVPVGSVGIAGEQTGVYPSATSGGWNLIGQTKFTLVDFTREAPTTLQVGDKVSFYPITKSQFSAN